MAKINFKIKKLDGQQYLMYELLDDVVVDEDVLSMAEEGQLENMVSMGYIEDTTCDSLCYDVTEMNTLNEYFEFTINKKTVLKILKNIVHTLVNLRELAIPLNYVVLHKGYIYIDVETLDLEFLCIPIESQDIVKVDVAGFVRGVLSGLKYDKDENGDYVAKLFSFINDKELFSLRGLMALIEAISVDTNTDTNDLDIDDEYSEGEIIADYEELESYEVEPEENVVVLDRQEMLKEAKEHLGKGIVTEGDIKTKIDEVEDIQQADELEQIENPIIEENIVKEDMPIINEEDIPIVEEIEDKDLEDNEIDKAVIDNEVDEDIIKVSNNDEASIIDEEMSEIGEEGVSTAPSTIKINRVQVIQNSNTEDGVEEDIEDKKEKKDKKIEKEKKEEKEAVAKQPKAAPKPMPYLVRVNTEEKIMVNKPNFKLGKASIGMDYRIADNSAISRNHAAIYCKDGVYFIKDNKSTNHTYVNGVIIEEIDMMLTHDAEVVLGDEEFIFKIK